MRLRAVLSAFLGPLALVLPIVLVAVTSTSAAEPQPFTPKGNSVAIKAKIVEEFPEARFSPKEGIVCSTGEHSMNGPTSYCFVEFITGSTWNLVEAALQLDLVDGTGVSIGIYSHTTWKRKWRRCRLRNGVPGRLFSNDDCGRGQPERPRVETDGDIIAIDVWPKIKAHKPLHAVDRDFIFSEVAPYLSHYRMFKKDGAYIFTNALGDSFRYRP